ncbi:MAG: endonuclease/exonuclease/phosphatase family protein [Crocinitomicaceae bacterium]|nr:endonuclease/exonuclease/phosphatase family protein [Crocinitomicaceae bacterium]
MGFAGNNPQLDNSGIRVMFYNVENLFHPTDDPDKSDEEFTKEGTRYWTFNRYKQKLANIGKTVIAVGEWEPPAIIGLCEVENIQCLEDLVYTSPLKKWNYKIVHEESRDNRGIDVALIYRADLITEISHEAIQLNFPNSTRPSRDILYFKGSTAKDTVHFFVNHWPSRYGGQLETEGKRNYAAEVLKSKFDSLRSDNANAKVLAMGDFNDHPDDDSMEEILMAKKAAKGLGKSDLINMIWQYEDDGLGTHKYQHEWGVLDQIVITPAFLNDTNRIHTNMKAAKIFMGDFLLEAEKDGVGKTPNRTYIGFQFHGGYSDHLPIFVDLYF